RPQLTALRPTPPGRTTAPGRRRAALACRSTSACWPDPDRRVSSGVVWPGRGGQPVTSRRRGLPHRGSPGITSTWRGAELERVTVLRAERRVLDEVTARIPAAGITVVAGPSGAGKTTLLRLCNRLEVPDQGVISYRGQPLHDLDPLVLRRRVGMVFQRPT